MNTNARCGLVGLELGFADRKEVILAGVMVLVIVAAIAMAARTLWGGHDRDFVFECTQCHNQFKVAWDDPEVLSSPMGPYGVMKVCPKCDQKAGRCADPCPACGERIIKPDDGWCPECGVNIPWFIGNEVRRARGLPPLPPPVRPANEPPRQGA